MKPTDGAAPVRSVGAFRRRPARILLAGGALAAIWLVSLTVRERLAAETAEIKRQTLHADAENAQSAVLARMRASITAHPTDPAPHLALASYLSQSGDVSGAVQEARSAVRLAPRNAAAHDALGDLYDRAGETDLAIDELRDALRCRPNDANAAGLLAYKYLYLGWTRRAESLLQSAIAEAQQNAQLHATLGLVKFQNGEMAAAEREMRTARRIAPEDPALVAPLFDVYQHAGKVADELRLVQDGLRLTPSDPGLLARRAQAFLDARQPKQALEGANRALQARPGFLNALYVRALAQESLGNTAAAVTDLEAVAAGQPSAQVLVKLGRLYMQAGREAEARRTLAAAATAQADLSAIAHDIAIINARDGDAAAHLDLGRRFLKSGDASRSITELKRAFELGARGPTVRRDLASALRAAGRGVESDRLPAR